MPPKSICFKTQISVQIISSKCLARKLTCFWTMEMCSTNRQPEYQFGIVSNATSDIELFGSSSWIQLEHRIVHVSHCPYNQTFSRSSSSSPHSSCCPNRFCAYSSLVPCFDNAYVVCDYLEQRRKQKFVYGTGELSNFVGYRKLKVKLFWFFR